MKVFKELIYFCAPFGKKKKMPTYKFTAFCADDPYQGAFDEKALSREEKNLVLKEFAKRAADYGVQVLNSTRHRVEGWVWPFDVEAKGRTKDIVSWLKEMGCVNVRRLGSLRRPRRASLRKKA